MYLSENIKKQKLMYAGIETIIMGVSLHIATKYFGIPIFSMEYGIAPVIHTGFVAEYGTLVFAFFGVIMISFSELYENIRKRINRP